MPQGWPLWVETETPAAGNWASRHKGIIIVGTFAVVLVLASVAAGSGGSTNASTTTDTAPAAPPVDPNVAAATGWIHQTGTYTHEVQVAMQSVQAGIAVLQTSNSVNDVASFSSLAKQAGDFCDDAAMGLVDKIDGHMSDQRQEAFDAANELSDAMKALRAYLDNSKPSDLGDFQTKYADGLAHWNEAVKALWDRAGIATPPTI